MKYDVIEMKKIKIIFAGTDIIGSELLKSLTTASDFFDVSLVITSPDKPAGRKLQLQPSPIKRLANEMNIEVFQPENINDDISIKKIKALNPDIILVMAYGQLLKQEFLNIPTITCLNVHASLLPKYRGASPIQSAILNDDQNAGVSLMKMILKMDAGPVYQTFDLKIDKKETSRSLSEKLGKLSAIHIPSTLLKIADGKLTPQNQEEAKVSYCGKISKADGQIDWNQPADVIERKIRAFDPWPGTFTFFEGKRLKILSAEVVQSSNAGSPGLVTEKGIACKNNMLQPIEVQMEGGKMQRLKEFLKGNPEFIGIHLNQISLNY